MTTNSSYRRTFKGSHTVFAIN